MSLDVCSSVTGVSWVRVSSSVQVIQECQDVVLIYSKESVTKWIRSRQSYRTSLLTHTPPTSSSPPPPLIPHQHLHSFDLLIWTHHSERAMRERACPFVNQTHHDALYQWISDKHTLTSLRNTTSCPTGSLRIRI